VKTVGIRENEDKRKILLEARIRRKMINILDGGGKKW
jgi:hypothetical protein